MTSGVHKPVLLEEAVSALNVSGASVVVDGTFGRGGHSRAILSRLSPAGRLLALDRDPDAVVCGRAIDDPRFTMVHARFSEIDRVLADWGIDRVDGVLLDVGVSSPQLDTASRGFSFRLDAPLDMRMDPTVGESAADWLNRAAAKEIQQVLRGYGEERYAKQVAAAIVGRRSHERLVTTGQLAQLVASVVRVRERGQNPATRVFQAVRIFINRELEELQVTLPKAFDRLAPGGRLAVITFHSLEDRIAKRFMQSKTVVSGIPDDWPLRADQMPKAEARWVIKRALPSPEEQAENRRARSAKLRVIEKA